MALTALPAMAADAPAKGGVQFNVTIPANFEGELNGRCLVIISRDASDDNPVYAQLSATGVPVFGKTVFGLKAGDTVTFTEDDPDIYGFPFQMSGIPHERLCIQAFFITYTQFNRSDGSSIWGMADHGGGGSFRRNPYNYYSDIRNAKLESGSNITLLLNNMIDLPTPLLEGEVTQQGNYVDTDNVKYVKMRSEMLSEFWGTDMYIGANVLLPKGYSTDKKYPVIYQQGHFPAGAAPLNYGRNADFTKFWDSGLAPQMLAVTIRDANMFYDTSYSVNSANLGPWGDAIVYELIPFLEDNFSIIAEPWARILTGGSTGGWESLAMQVFYPDEFGATWSLCPDPVTFHYYQIVDIYNDKNAYTIDTGWFTVERPGSRRIDGNVRYMMKDECHYEIALGGLDALSLGQWAIWEACYGPQKEDGYPARVWDPITGEIDKEVAEYWKENYDLLYILRDNWAELGPKLIGKIFLRGGDMDSYYLNLAQYELGEFLDGTNMPYYEGYSKTFPRVGHSGNITNQELMKEISDQMIKYGPKDVQDILFGD